jgi:hypothetical protein
VLPTRPSPAAIACIREGSGGSSTKDVQTHTIRKLVHPINLLCHQTRTVRKLGSAPLLRRVWTAAV